MVSRRAECTCGQLSATCEGEPLRVSVCHCLACKRRTGSAFGYSGWWREKDVTIAGRATEYVRIGDDGGHITSGFCPLCGAAIYTRNNGIPGVVGIPAGAFADLSFPPPTVSVYHESRGYRWLELHTEPLEKRG
ncbi:MAG: GFA family protein [Alphaproteobacteria bacterium]|nr:GFA family protein [Alphaproteobacteria bacterium]MBL6940260.1 GFA family protein [Alphaproteobacteria bacterium]MBL7096832.1 GFA family protein [Alphaproteobacteria bacterium]